MRHTALLLALSLLGTRTDPNVMNISTGKNTIVLNSDATKYAAWCYGSRFVPAVVVLSLCHLLSILSLEESAGGGGSDCASRNQSYLSATPTASSVSPDQVTSDANCRSSPATAADLLPLINLLDLCFLHLYLVATSASFISRGHQIWQRHPGHCPAWILVSASVLVAVCTYAVVAGLVLCRGEGDFTCPTFPGVPPAPLASWVLWVVGLLAVVGINELVKRQEIKVEVRYQKRERLEFGTKLGINSPF